MKTEFKQNVKILSSMIDQNAGVGIVNAVTLLQDNMCEYFKQLKSDGIYMIDKCHAFFVLTKTHLRFNSKLGWCDEVELRTDLINKSNVRLTLSNSIYKDGVSVIDGIQELCAMDSDNRSLRRVETTLFPGDAEVVLETSNLTFEKINVEFSDDDLRRSIVVEFDNLDFYRHVNNVEYVKFILNTLGLDFYTKNTITELELNYISECVFGDVLNVFIKNIDDRIYFQIKKEDKVVFKGYMVYCGV
jgi:acyl-CoA thioesterase FadM